MQIECSSTVRRSPPKEAFGIPAIRIFFAALSIVAFSVSANAKSVGQPPSKACTSVDKREYTSAKKRKLPYGRGTYVRTGGALHRYYWYCP